MLKEDYIISIVGKQRYEDESQNSEISVNTYGSYSTRNGSRYIAYKEYNPENNRDSCLSILKIEKDSTVTMTKSGTGTRLILEKGRRHNCVYNTDFGQLMIGIYAEKIENTLDDQGGELKITYTMDVNSVFSSENDVFVTVTPAKF